MWLYSVKDGRLFHNNTLIATGYAGAKPHVNDPTAQITKNIGPLPNGIYRIEAPQDNPHTGLYSLPLTPDPCNEMFLRGDFLCHGDTTPPTQSASEGCIIMTLTARQQMVKSGDKLLVVVSGLS